MPSRPLSPRAAVPLLTAALVLGLGGSAVAARPAKNPPPPTATTTTAHDAQQRLHVSNPQVTPPRPWVPSPYVCLPACQPPRQVLSLVSSLTPPYPGLPVSVTTAWYYDLRAEVRTADGRPVVGVPVAFSTTTSSDVGTATTDAAGTATVRLLTGALPPSGRWTATFAGDATHAGSSGTGTLTPVVPVPPHG